MNKTRQWAVLTAMGCLAVLVAGWMLVVKPERSHAAQLRTQATGLQGDNNQLRAHVNQLRQMQKDIPAQQKTLAAIATKIPDNPALPALIRQLSAAADGAGVNLVSLAPGQPTTVATAAVQASSPASKTAAVTTSPLASISVAINVQGSYFNVEQFFSAVESLSRAMLVNGFTLAPLQSGASNASSATALPLDTLNAQITATVFESPQTAPVAAATSTTVH
jgi:Tfp pilus assembly protein PilO